MPVVVFEVSTDGVLQFAGAAMNAAAQLPFGEQRKPALDQVEPGAGGGSEVQMEARMAQERSTLPSSLASPNSSRSSESLRR